MRDTVREIDWAFDRLAHVSEQLDNGCVDTPHSNDHSSSNNNGGNGRGGSMMTPSREQLPEHIFGIARARIDSFAPSHHQMQVKRRGGAFVVGGGFVLFFFFSKKGKSREISIYIYICVCVCVAELSLGQSWICIVFDVNVNLNSFFSLTFSFPGAVLVASTAHGCARQLCFQ